MALLSKLGPQDAIDPRELDTGLRWLLRSSVSGKMMDTLAVGTFLTAFALQLGASNLMIGLLASVPHLGHAGQIIGVYLIERMRRRRAIAIGAGMIARPMLLVVAAAALIPNTTAALAVVLFGLAVRYLFGSVILCAWNSWVRDLVPEDQRAGFLARRLRGMTFFAMVASLAAAGFIDLWHRYDPASDRFAYMTLFLLAFVFGAFSTYALRYVPEPRMPETEGRPDLFELYSKPLRDANFRRLLLFLGSWNFAINLAAPFFTVHMLKRLELDLLPIMIFAVLSQLANVAAVRRWGHVIDRFGNKPVLTICAPLFLLCIFAWIFTTAPNRYEWTIPILIAIHVLTGISSAGVGLATSNLAMKLAPRGEATAYLSTNSIVNSVSAGLAPIVGGLLADSVLSHRFSLVIHWISPKTEYLLETLRLEQWDFFFVSAALLGLYSLHRLSAVREEGEIQERPRFGEIFEAARGGMHNLSSVAGLKRLTEYHDGHDAPRPPKEPDKPH